MSKRSFLYSAAFIGLVAASGLSVPQQAQAQKGMALQPATQWAVSKVEANGSQNGYCAAARRFRPNTILTFARNAHDEASFALDFQQPKFRQAEGMQVMLDPGAGQQRAFEVYPVSNQAFVIRLGRDEQFFGALEKTGFLRVEFDGKAYHFDLSDIDTGQAKLATCIANGVVPAAGDEGSPIMADAGDSQFQRDVDDLRRQLAKLRSDNQRMSGKAPVTEGYDTSSSTIMTDQLASQITQLELENQELKSKLKAINAGNIEALRSPKDVATIQRLTEENQQLRTALETEQAQDIQAEVLYDQIQSLEDENKRLKDGSFVQGDASGVADKDILALIEENETLKAQLAAIDTAAGDDYDLRQAVAALQTENEALKAGDLVALQESNAQIERLKQENKRLQSVMEATATSGDPAFVVQELKGQVDRLAADMEAKESKLLEMSKLATEVEMLKTTNEELEKQLIESALRGPASVRGMTQKIAALETQNDSLLQKIQSESDTAAAVDAASIDVLKAENETLKKTIAETQTLMEENKKLQSEVEMLRRDNQTLKERAEAAAPGGEPSAELQKLRDDNETLRAQLQQKEGELAELASLRSEVERLRAENENLRNNPPVPTANSPIPGGAPNPEVENLTRENENLRQQIANSNAAGKDTEIADLKAKLAEQEAKVAAADEAIKKAEESAKAAKEDAAKAKKEAKAAAKKAEEQKVAETTPAPIPAEEAIAAKVKTEEGNVEDELIRAAAANGASPPPAPPEEKIVVTEEPPVHELQPPPVNEAQAQEQKAAEEITWNEPPAKQGVAISPEPLSPPVMEQEMIRLEKELSEAKASGDQMAIQQAARDYMNLKARMSPAQELAASNAKPTGQDRSKDLLGYAGTAKAPVADVQAEVSPPPANDVSTELLEARTEAPVLSPAPMNDAMAQEQQMAAAEGMRPAGQAALPTAPSEDAYRARINDSRMVTPESVQQSYDRSQEIMSGSAAGSPSSQWAQATPADVTSSSHGGVYQPAVGVPQILDSADIVAPQAVSIVQNASGAGKVAYQWKSNKVFGSAIQQPLSDPSRFDGEVQAYLEQTKQRCGQDFAAVADGTTSSNGTRIDTYEIACVGKGVSSSASLIFFAKGGTFTVLAHEAPTEELENAMDIRDRLVKTIKGS